MNQTPIISVAPMMDWTDRHCRYFHRLVAPRAVLYTEMVTAAAVLRGDRTRLLGFDPAEHPVVMQLGGSDQAALAEAAVIGEAYGYDEINLNCGCPSDRVQSGCFGAVLMKTPELVAQCVAAMQGAVKIPVTVKHRIGVDREDSFEFLDRFVDIVAGAGCKSFIVHARAAWLQGLSPKENRSIPPLRYEYVYRLKEKYPHLCIVLNGGITNIEDITFLLSSRRKPGSGNHVTEEQPGPGFRRDDMKEVKLNGLMIGRAAYQNPWFLREIEEGLFGAPSSPPSSLTREDVALKMIDYARAQRETHGTPVKSITRHMLGLYHGQKGGKAWRRALSSLPYEDGADETGIKKSMEVVR